MSDLPPDLVSFDLSKISAEDYRKGSRGFRVVTTAVYGVIVVAGAITLALRPSILDVPSNVGEVVLIILGFGIPTVLLNVLLSHGPVRLEVGAAGLRLIYSKHRTKEILWNKPGVHVTIWKNPSTLPDGRAYPLAAFDLRTIRPVDNPLTEEAFTAVLASARAAGMNIQATNASGRPDRLIYPIRRG